MCLGASCNIITSSEDDFYSYSKSWDLWRVPILQPYEMVSATNTSAEDWFLIIEDHHVEGPDFFRSGQRFQLSSVKTIGILDSVIVVSNENHYWPKLSGQYSSTLIIDLKTKRQYIYSNKHHPAELNETMKALKVEAIEMLEWEMVMHDFLDNKKLPEIWNKQRLNTDSQQNQP